MTQAAAPAAIRPAGSELVDLDPAEAGRKHRQRDHRFNVVQIPVLRVLGFSFLAALVFVHNRWVLGSFSLVDFLRFVLVLGLYSAASWATLALLYGKTGRFHLGRAFLTADIALMVLAIYHSGGEKSWLYFLLMVRVADQAHTSFRQVRHYAHVSTLGYLLLLVYLGSVEGRSLSWPVEIAKALIIYFSNLYISFTARTAEALRRRTSQAIRVARQVIGELQDKQRQLEEARTQAEAASRLKSEFLANMSHEIRTPLNGILGMTHVALQGKLDGQQRDNLQTIRSSAYALLKIVDDVLDFSRIEAGALELELRAFALRDCLEDAMKILAPEAQGKGLELAWEVAPGLHDALRGDPGRLRQVLLNLVGNAVKFTEAGRVEVRAEPEAASAGEVGVHFLVRDTGIGIPPDRQAAIFEAFTQADGSLTRRHGGTGLGLAIAARLVGAMGGRLWAESEEGKGSTFHFTARFGRADSTPVPMPPAAREAPWPPAAGFGRNEARRPLRILLAEDNPVNVRVAARLLEGWGHAVVVAGNGREALAALEGERFDLAVLDVQMPVMTGLDVAAAVRARERGEGGRTPLIALTAHALPSDRERCLAAGMDGYVSKPVDPAVLFEAVEAAAAGGAEAGDPQGKAPAFDRSATLTRFGGDAALLKEVAQVFLDDWPRLRAELRDALERRDPEGVRAAAHAIKGTVSVFSAQTAVDAAARLEQLGKTGDLAGIDLVAEELDGAVARLNAALSAVAGPARA